MTAETCHFVQYLLFPPTPQVIDVMELGVKLCQTETL